MKEEDSKIVSPTRDNTKEMVEQLKKLSEQKGWAVTIKKKK